MSHEYTPRPKSERIRELRETIAGLVQQQRYYRAMLGDAGIERTRGSINSLRKQANEWMAKANAMQQELDGAQDMLIAAADRAEELQAEIVRIENEEQLAKLESIVEQIGALTK